MGENCEKERRAEHIVPVDGGRRKGEGKSGGRKGKWGGG